MMCQAYALASKCWVTDSTTSLNIPLQHLAASKQMDRIGVDACELVGTAQDPVHGFLACLSC